MTNFRFIPFEIEAGLGYDGVDYLKRGWLLRLPNQINEYVKKIESEPPLDVDAFNERLKNSSVSPSPTPTRSPENEGLGVEKPPISKQRHLFSRDLEVE